MEKAYEEVKLCVANNKHNLSSESLQMCLEALRIVKDIKHKGWTNYATWLAASYIDNNKTTYKFYNNLREELQKAAEPEENAIGVLAQTMEYQFGAEAVKLEEIANEMIWSSIINNAQCSINYYEIAKAFYKDSF